MIPHSRPTIDGGDAEAVLACLESGFVAEGAATSELERTLASQIEVSAAVATGSGSQALLLALRALSLPAGGGVVIPTYCCPDVAGSVEEAGLNVILSDVGEDYLVNVEAIETYRQSNACAIIVPHLFGRRADAAALARFGLPLIEDFAQRIPQAREIVGDLGIISFGGTKMLTAGEGGCVLVPRPSLVPAVRSQKAIFSGRLKKNLYCLSDLQASLVTSQLRRATRFVLRRQELAQEYLSRLNPIKGLVTSAFTLDNQYFRFLVQLKDDCALGVDHFVEFFEARNIAVRRPVSLLIHHLMPASRPFPVADRLFAKTVSLPIYPSLTHAELSLIVETVHEWFMSAGMHKKLA